jgi:hypothetical protein
VSGVSVFRFLSLAPDSLYKTTPKWHGFLMIKLSVFQASGAAYVKLRLAGTANRLNVEY